MGGGNSKAGWPIVDMSGKTVIVTGANTGIGFETAKHIAFMGAKVILACRTESKAKAAILRMQADFMEWILDSSTPKPPSYESATGETEEATLDVEFMPLDLGSLQSVVDFATAYKEKGYPLHVLLCNAGIAYTSYGQTGDGFEKQFQTNYLSHFLLTMHLLPVMRSSGEDCRIINVSSIVHSSGKLDIANIQGDKNYNRSNAYSNSKLFQIMSMYCFERRLKDTDIGSFCLHPGIILTDISKEYQNDSGMFDFAVKFAKTFGIATTDVTKGAATSIYLAVSPHLRELSGNYFSACTPVTPAAYSKNVKKQEVLWNYSLGLLENYLTEDLLKDMIMTDEELGLTEKKK